VQPGYEMDYGWAQPSHDGTKERSVYVVVALNGEKTCRELVDISDVRKTQTRQITVHSAGFVLETTRQFERSVIVLLDEGCRQALGSSFQVEVKLRQLGVSLVQEMPEPYELLFVHLADSYFSYKNSDADTEDWALEVQRAQVDCQKAGRLEGETKLQKAYPAVILANHGNEDNKFLSVKLNRHATSSRDLVLPKASIGIDWLDVVIDDDWLDPLLTWIEQCNEEADGTGVHLDDVLTNAGIPAQEDYQSPLLPSLVQCEQLLVSRVDITLWCSLQLKSLDFLPAAVRNFLKFITQSNSFTLKGAQLQLPMKSLKPKRGSLADTLAELGAKYATAFLLNTSELFNRSSLNLPLAPLEFVADQSVKLGISSATSWITNFVYRHCSCTARCRRRKEATQLQKKRVRHRQPRLLFAEVGGVRLWSDIEAELPRQLSKSCSTGVQEILVLKQQPQSTIVLLLFSDRLALAQLQYPFRNSSADSAEMPDQHKLGEFAEWLGEDLGVTGSAKAASGRPGFITTSMSRLSSVTLAPESFSSVGAQHSNSFVPGSVLVFSDLRAVGVQTPQDAPDTRNSSRYAMLLTPKQGDQRSLPFGSAPLGAGVKVREVLNCLADALRAVIVHPGRKAGWDLLHKTLHPEEVNRWHQNM